jgi:hypothetical protein
MAMAFGPDCLRPIQSRLGAAELDAYEAACRKAMDFGHAQVPAHWNAASVDKAAAFRLFEREVLARYSWMSEKNLSYLFSQGCCYACKDGCWGETPPPARME